MLTSKLPTTDVSDRPTGGFDRDVEDFSRGARAIVVLPDQGGAARDAEARLAETAGLALAIGVEVIHKVAFRVRAPKPATLIGSGQVKASPLVTRRFPIEKARDALEALAAPGSLKVVIEP